MNSKEELNNISLLPAEDQVIIPKGLVVKAQDMASLAPRLLKQAAHYKTLRVTSFQNLIIFWTLDEQAQLPWVNSPVCYLKTMGKSAFLPVYNKLNIPEKFAEALLQKVSDEKTLLPPLLFFKLEGELQVIGLGKNSHLVANIDWLAWPGEGAQ